MRITELDCGAAPKGAGKSRCNCASCWQKWNRAKIKNLESVVRELGARILQMEERQVHTA